VEDRIGRIWQQHRGKIIGSLAGLAVAVLVIIFGFWWALFIAGCVGAGYLVGKRIDDEHDVLSGVLRRFVPPRED